MIEDLPLISMSLVYVFIGSLGRAMVGLFKVHNSTVDLHFFGFNWRRVLLEVCTSMILGTIGMIIVIDMGWVGAGVGFRVVSLLGGLLGPDILKFITKKLGITKAFDIRFTDEQVLFAEFNPRQIAAMKYIKENGMITSSIYQDINETTPITAKRDLAQLTEKRQVKRMGSARATHYEL